MIRERPNVGLLALTHTRKAEGHEDAVTGTSGTHGVTGGADVVLSLTGRRGAPRRVLESVSRDAEDARLVLRWEAGGGGLIREDADADDPTVLMTDDDARVYRAVVAAEGPITADDLGDIPNVRNRLASLTKRGYLRRVSRGEYVA